jgi:hypothetical protein
MFDLLRGVGGGREMLDPLRGKESLEMSVDELAAVVGDNQDEFMSGGVLNFDKEGGEGEVGVGLLLQGVYKLVLGEAINYLEEVEVSPTQGWGHGTTEIHVDDLKWLGGSRERTQEGLPVNF